MLKKIVIFPSRKKYACFNFFIIGSVSNICSNASNFPAKKLRKIRCSKYACAAFFFLNKITTFNLLSSCIIINKIVDSFLHNLLLSHVIYSINHTCFTLQIILFVLKCIVLSKLFNYVSKNFSYICTKTFGGKIWRNLHRVPPDNFIGKKSNSPSLKFLAKNYSNSISSERL